MKNLISQWASIVDESKAEQEEYGKFISESLLSEEDEEEMRKLSQVSGEADLTDAGEKDVVNVLRGLLNSRT